jgi:hypothetical protein
MSQAAIHPESPGRDEPSLPQGEPQSVYIASIRRRLVRMCRRARAALVARGLFILISTLGVSIVGMILIDYVLRLPMGVRFIVLGGLGYLAFVLLQKFLRPAIALDIRPVDMALRIEQQEPSLRGILASSVDLKSHGLTNKDAMGNPSGDDEIASALSHAAIATACRRLNNVALPRTLRLDELMRNCVVFLIVIGSIIGIGFQSPNLSSIGLSRVLMPWNDVSWPKRYQIVDTTLAKARAIDISVPIRAAIGSSTSETSGARARVTWRLVDERGKEVSSWSETMLAPQYRRDELTGSPIYEQLIDVSGAASGLEDQRFDLEYSITTRDDQTSVRAITLVRPPKLELTTVEIGLPQYAQVLDGSELVLSGLKETTRYDSVISPVLGGSRVKITMAFSKGVKLPEDTTPAWAGVLSQSGELLSIDQPTKEIIEIELVARESLSLEPGVVDEMGIAVRSPIVISLGVLSDQNPGVALTEPQRDELVSSHAVLDIVSEMSDDFGLARGSIFVQLAREPSGSSGAPHEPIGAEITLVSEEFNAAQQGELQTVLEINELQATSNDQVWIRSTAHDLRAQSTSDQVPIDGFEIQSSTESVLGITESAVRVLRVVEDAELIEQARAGLNPVRNALRQIDEAQSQLQQQLRNGELVSSQAQRALTQRIKSNLREIEQIAEGVERNRLDDVALESLLDDAQSILDDATQAAQRASDQIDRGENENAQNSQRKVRDRVGELLSMLDRGQDSWMALRAVQQLRDELEGIRDDTKQLGSEIGGRSMDQLTPEERSALERILDRQLANADDAGDAITTLEDISNQLEESDPTQAEALSRAADQARASQLEQKLKEAGAQIESNQTSSAAQTQTEILEELEEMLEEIENSIKNRDSALRRELASIIDSLKQIIAAQETELARLANTQPENVDETLDDAMVTLSGNTLAVRDAAMGAFPETRSIADLITTASNAQSDAIGALRQQPPKLSDASRFEQTSLLNLKSALEEAERLDDQAADRQAQRLRDELKEKYKEALATQTAVTDETLPLVGEALNRRQRADARSLGKVQTEIQEQLAELLEETKELNEAPIFALAHSQLDRLMRASAEGLTKRTIENRVEDAQRNAEVILTTLVEVLSDDNSDQDESDFDDGSQGGGEGGSGSGEEPVIPPVAQLKLLRTMQQLVADQTRSFADNPEQVIESDIDDLSSLQSELFEQGQALIESMKPQQQSAPVPVENGQRPQQDPDPEEGETP